MKLSASGILYYSRKFCYCFTKLFVSRPTEPATGSFYCILWYLKCLYEAGAAILQYQNMQIRQRINLCRPDKICIKLLSVFIKLMGYINDTIKLFLGTLSIVHVLNRKVCRLGRRSCNLLGCC